MPISLTVQESPITIQLTATEEPDITLEVSPAPDPIELTIQDGVPGTAATITIGTVTQIGHEYPPTVTNTGTPQAAILNFEIPVGAPGDDGEDGQGTQGPAGTITIGTVTTLAPGSPVTIENVGTAEAAVLDIGIPAGAPGDPGQDGEDGEDGTAATITIGTVSTLAPGSPVTVENVGTPEAAILDIGIPAGAPGEDGEDGTAATITIGTVTTLAPGSDATVENVGTAEAAILDIGIPAGGSDLPPYVAGRFYPCVGNAVISVSLAVPANLARFLPFMVRETVTISALTFRTGTGQSSTNSQLALYANDNTTMRPTGDPLATTADASNNGNVTNVSAALSTNVQLIPGVLYWAGHNTNSTTATFAAIASTFNNLGTYIGSTTMSNMMGNTMMISISTPLTYGTWGDLTAAAWTENTVGNRGICLGYLVHSVP